MRICSLQPGATEIVYALGLQDQLYGVTSKCDYPGDARNKPVVVRSIFDGRHLSSGDISRTISENFGKGQSIYQVDQEILDAADPDLLLTQAICEVWAISARQVAELSNRLRKPTEVLSLTPTYLGDVLEDIRRVGRAAKTESLAESLADQLQARIDAVSKRAAQASRRPRVLQLEWANPLLCGGHWVVEMVELAGGVPCFGSKEAGSSRLDWLDIVDSQPDIVLFMPCGFGLDRALEDMSLLTCQNGWGELPAVQNRQVYVIDAGAYTSRLGPRLANGLEIMAEIIHPELFSGMTPPGAAVRLNGQS